MLMTKPFRFLLNAIQLVIILSLLSYTPVHASTLGIKNSRTPASVNDSRSISCNTSSVLSRVHIDGVLEFPIVQQPKGNDKYVSPVDGEITQFSTPSNFGNIGLLAHNNLSGRFFSNLKLGQDVHLVYGNGKIESFVITQILRYQALQPTNPYSSFRDLTTSNVLTVVQVFEKAYQGSPA